MRAVEYPEDFENEIDIGHGSGRGLRNPAELIVRLEKDNEDPEFQSVEVVKKSSQPNKSKSIKKVKKVVMRLPTGAPKKGAAVSTTETPTPTKSTEKPKETTTTTEKVAKVSQEVKTSDQDGAPNKPTQQSPPKVLYLYVYK